jgi:hypothetical protein
MKMELNCFQLNSSGLWTAALNKKQVDERTPCSDGTYSEDRVELVV